MHLTILRGELQEVTCTDGLAVWVVDTVVYTNRGPDSKASFKTILATSSLQKLGWEVL